MHLFISLNNPHQWVKYNVKQAIVASSGVVQTLDEIELSKDIKRVIAVVSGSDIVAHQVTIPGKNKKKVIDAIPFYLEEELTNNIEDMHFALQNWVPNQSSEVLVAKDELIQNWLDVFSSAGITLDDIVPEYLLVPKHPGVDVTIAKTSDDNYLLKLGDFTGTSVDANLLELWREVEGNDKSVAVNDEDMVRELITNGFENSLYWDIGNDFSSWLQHGAAKKLLFPCMLQGKYDQTKALKSSLDIKRAIGFAVAGVGLYLGALLANYLYLDFQSSRLDTQASNYYTTTFPDKAGQIIKDPVFEMRKDISRLRSGNYGAGNFLPLLQVLSTQLKRNNISDLENIRFEENTLNTQITVANFEVLDILEATVSELVAAYADVSIEDKISQEGNTQGVLKIILKEQ